MAAIVLHSAVHETIGQEIVDGVHTAGSVLTLEALQNRFGVSRTVMREVMRGLESQRLVESRRRVGIIVQPHTAWKVYDPQVVAWHLKGVRSASMLRSLLQMRISIEPTAAKLAAQNPDIEQRRKILDLGYKLRNAALANDSEKYHEFDLSFHLAILQTCENPLFAALEEITLVTMSLRQVTGAPELAQQPAMLELHVLAGEAIHNGNPDASFALVSELMKEYRDVLEPSHA